MKNSFLKYLLLASFAFISVSGYGAEPVKQDAFRMVTMEGEVAGKTRYNLSVVYKKDGENLYEAVIPLDREKIKLKRYKSFQDIRDGDVIRVEFKEFYKLDDKGKEVRTGRLATVVELVKNSVAGKLISKD